MKKEKKYELYYQFLIIVIFFYKYNYLQTTILYYLQLKVFLFLKYQMLWEFHLMVKMLKQINSIT